MMRKTHLFWVSLLLLISSSPSSAYAPDCTPATVPERQYVGGSKAVPVVWGGSVNIETQLMELCPTSSYSLWVGLTNVASGGAAIDGWVQMGYVRYSDMANNAVYTEAQSAGDKPSYYKLTKFQPPSGTNNYKVDFYWGGSNATSKWQFWQNSTLQWEIPYNTLGISPNRLDVTNEIADPGVQIAGTTANPVSWSDTRIKTTITGAYSPTLINRLTSHIVPSRVGSNMQPSDDAWETWDTRF